MATYVLSHRDSDGRFASYAAWLFLDHQQSTVAKENHIPTTFIEVQYGELFPLVIEKLTNDDIIYILDFSYDRETLDAVYDRVRALRVLDHHATAEYHLKGAPYAHFDKTKSGALLAWEHFFPDSAPPLTCLLVNDYDLWQWKYEETAAFQAWLQFDNVKQDFTKWHTLSIDPEAMAKAIETGTILEKHNQSIIENFANRPENFVIGNILENDCIAATYAIHNGLGILHSQLGSFFCNKYRVDISISYRVMRDRVVFSARSNGNSKVKAIQLAEKYEGGGHQNAAGFYLSLEEGLALVKKLKTEFSILL